MSSLAKVPLGSVIKCCGGKARTNQSEQPLSRLAQDHITVGCASSFTIRLDRELLVGAWLAHSAATAMGYRLTMGSAFRCFRLRGNQRYMNAVETKISVNARQIVGEKGQHRVTVMRTQVLARAI
jgi:hypothetical protein